MRKDGQLLFLRFDNRSLSRRVTQLDVSLFGASQKFPPVVGERRWSPRPRFLLLRLNNNLKLKPEEINMETLFYRFTLAIVAALSLTLGWRKRMAGRPIPQTLWSGRRFSTRGQNKDVATVPRSLLRRLTDAVCYAA